MKKSSNTDDLRKRAEIFLMENPEIQSKKSFADIYQLMHELYLYQIELELQNEELRMTQLALEESHSRYVDLYEFAPFGYFLLDNEGIINEVNLAGAQLLGLERRYIIKRKFCHFISSDYRDVFDQYCQQVFHTAKQQICELKLIKKDNSLLFVELAGMVILHTIEQYGHFRITITDITLRRKAEMQVRQQELALAHFSRLTTLGEMVSLIAHEINQPLTAIVHHIGGCLIRLQKFNIDPIILEALERVMAQAERAGAVIHRIKDFLRKGVVESIALDINTVIRKTLSLIEHEIKAAQIDLQLKLSESLPFVKGDLILLQQVILNIVQNAIEAMRMSVTKYPQLSIKTCYMLQGYVEIIIQDNGNGIPSHLKDKIFEPFFTTKANGAGMGLAIVRTIIEQQGGHISVFSSATNVTQFHLLLPSMEEIK